MIARGRSELGGDVGQVWLFGGHQDEHIRQARAGLRPSGDLSGASAPCNLPHMTTPLLCLLFFAAWTIGLVVLGIGPIRVGKVLLGGARPNSFPADTPHGSPAYRRLLRAHLNAVENLPVFATIVVVAHLANISSARFDQLAVTVAVARVAQTIAHISSGRSLIVNVRFACFAVQEVCLIWMIVLIALSS